jgi:hypothetical protein
MSTKPLTITDLARMGGRARAAKMTPVQRKRSAKKAWKKSIEVRKAKKAIA